MRRISDEEVAARERAYAQRVAAVHGGADGAPGGAPGGGGGAFLHLNGKPRVPQDAAVGSSGPPHETGAARAQRAP